MTHKAESANERIGRRIREAREALGINQAELARRIGLKQSTSLWRYETGHARVPLYKLTRIAHEVGQAVTALLGEDGQASPPPLDEVRRDLKEIAMLSYEAAVDGTPEALARARDAINAHLKRLGR